MITQKDLLFELIKINTVNSNNSDKVLDLITSYLNEKPFKVIEKNGVKNFIWKKGSGKSIMLSGHYDVVPAPGWEKRAFDPVEKDGWVYGRGAADMKGGLSALIEAYRITDPKDKEVILAIVGDEEKGGSNGAEVISEQFKPDYYLSGESLPTNTFLDIMKVGRRGVLQLEIRLNGKGSHGSRPNPELCPVYFLSTFISQLEQLRFNDKEDMVPTTIGVTNVECISGAINVHASSCKIILDIRYNYGNTPSDILNKIKRLLDWWGNYEINDVTMTKPYPFRNQDKKYESIVQDAFEKYTGVRPFPSTTGGSSDARFFALNNVPVIEAGPRGKNTHSIDERVALEDVLLLPKIYKEIINQL